MGSCDHFMDPSNRDSGVPFVKTLSHKQLRHMKRAIDSHECWRGGLLPGTPEWGMNENECEVMRDAFKLIKDQQRYIRSLAEPGK